MTLKTDKNSTKQSNQLNQLDDIQKQIEALEKQKIEIVENSRKSAKKQIEQILNKSGFSIEEIFTNYRKLKEKAKILIDGRLFEIDRKITNEIKQQLSKIGKNPADYDKARLIEEFGE